MLRWPGPAATAAFRPAAGFRCIGPQGDRSRRLPAEAPECQVPAGALSKMIICGPARLRPRLAGRPAARGQSGQSVPTLACGLMAGG
jgi:hypothetical protein